MSGKPASVSRPPKSSAAAPILARAPARLFAGTSGWAYPTWKPGFYPADVPAKKFLSFYSTQLNSCEVNYTFRKLPDPAKVPEWLAQVPEGFRFSFKAPQRITHFSRLRDCHAHVAEFLRFVAPAADAGKLGLLLFQLPPNFKCNLPLLREFLAAPGLLEARIAFEFRHESWFTDETEALLREHNAALCIAETEDFRSPEWHTAAAHTSFRLRQTGGYKPKQIAAFAERLVELAKTREVYVYFKHEDEPTGALNGAAFLRQALKRVAR
jgi:uncharacterized protein YecE (DUF72 family)